MATLRAAVCAPADGVSYPIATMPEPIPAVDVPPLQSLLSQQHTVTACVRRVGDQIVESDYDLNVIAQERADEIRCLTTAERLETMLRTDTVEFIGGFYVWSTAGNKIIAVFSGIHHRLLAKFDTNVDCADDEIVIETLDSFHQRTMVESLIYDIGAYGLDIRAAVYLPILHTVLATQQMTPVAVWALVFAAEAFANGDTVLEAQMISNARRHAPYMREAICLQLLTTAPAPDLLHLLWSVAPNTSLAYATIGTVLSRQVTTESRARGFLMQGMQADASSAFAVLAFVNHMRAVAGDAANELIVNTLMTKLLTVHTRRLILDRLSAYSAYLPTDTLREKVERLKLQCPY